MPETVYVDVLGMQQLAAELAQLGEDTGTVVHMIHTVPAATDNQYGPPEATAAVDSVLSVWAPEVELLRQVCDVVSLRVQLAADELAATDEGNAGAIGGD